MSEQVMRLRPNAARVAAKVMDGEAVIIDLTTGVYYSLTDVGGRIWALVEAGLPVARIVETVAQEYGVPVDRVAADVQALVTALLAEQIVTVADESGGDEAGKAAVLPDPPGSADGTPVYQTPELQIFRDMQDLLALDPPMPGLQDIPWK
jgi:hypothetical protein